MKVELQGLPNFRILQLGLPLKGFKKIVLNVGNTVNE